MRRHILMAVLVFVTTACFTNPPALLGQDRKNAESPKEGDGAVLRELPDEVRQLRLALQRSSAINHRLQVTLERIRLQQGRVDSLAPLRTSAPASPT
ncbi:MAG: hypothetical protein M3416_01815 [Acidobacteriota bacterium]|nr:hypothetical protein [Acidobacteriota bacterium]